ncbi:MAG: hypothetical protein KatS3mg035_0095 [Bacteroidia bacterium]|nr:MAG: hypothetical protein KatS3mg035_0095 [Bacteroidia bacterium]
MKIIFRYFVGLIYFLWNWGYTQPYSNAIPVIHGNDTLRFAWLGGWDNPRFQNIDLNQDGFLDLVVFDAQDQKLLTFLHSGIVHSTQFFFAPEYIAFFPKNIFRWILLVDYNGDGEPDLFTSTEYSSNVLVYKNRRKETGILSFELVHEPLYAEISPGTFAPLSIMDIPSITDVDFDGDVDILVVGPSGSRVELYRNYSHDLEMLDFRISSFCWGHFTDVADSVLRFELHQPCNFDQKTLHVGGTLCALSLNGDSLIDVLVSDQGPNNVVALYNGGTPLIAHMISQDTFFPSYDTSVNLQYYPAIYYVDVNGDHQKDLVFSPNGYDMPANWLFFMNHSEAGWLYLNQGNTMSPNFHLTQKNFFYDSILDGGSYSVPILFDEDKDGDLDFLLLINHKTVWKQNRYQSQKEWRFYENIQNNQEPIFLLKTTNYQNWNDWIVLDTLKNLHPTVADIDNDGDADFFIGHHQGRIIFLENQFTNTAHYVFRTSSYANVHIQANAAPHFVDMDKDTDLDLIVGMANGTLYFYENTGNAQMAQWSNPIPNWGGIYVTDEQNPIVANAKPFWYDIDKNGIPNLLIGNASGYIKVYEYLGNHQFQFLGDLFAERLTAHAAPWITDFQSDSMYFFVGNAKGGAYLFKEKQGYVLKNKPFYSSLAKVYPNPFTDTFYIETFFMKEYRWELWNSIGQKIQEGNCYGNYQYNSFDWNTGLYFLKIYDETHQQTFKLIKIL